MAEGVRFAVLGPVRAWRGETELVLGPPQQRAVMAALLLHEGAQVTVEGLVDGVWGERAPASAVHVIHQYIHRLRLALGREGAGHIRSAGGGYAVDFDADSCDLTRFTQLVADARKARADDDATTAADRYAEALALWNGPALAGVPGPYAAAQRSRLNELRLSAQEEHLAAVVDLGRYEQAVTELSALAAAHPLRERLRELQMLALYGAGRQADALEAYQQTRLLLREELGVDPAPGLRAVHQRTLAMDPALLRHAPAASAPAAPPGPPAPVPAQLPADVAHFTGREGQLDALTALAERTGGSVVIAAIGGTAGVGKTALAVHWAHRHAARFPDGVLYVNLRGFDPAGAPIEPGVAIHGFLDALGVPSGRIPAGLEAQAGLYRSLLSGRRMLVVLDNARNADQIRPLLPGAAGCLVLATSRDRLAGLVAVDGAHSLTLDLLTAPEARELLARRLGPDRVARERPEVDELIERCARLPLALNIAAAHAALHPDRPLAALVEELNDTHRRLDALTTGEAAADVRVVFSWSYHTLSPGAARLFRLLGVHPGTDLGLPALASLAAADPDATRHALAELARVQLVIEHLPGRYTLHDLLRAYAAEQLHAHDDETERLRALRRLADFFTHTACAAENVLVPARYAIRLEPPAPGARPLPFAEAPAALAWLEAEYPNLLALQRAAVARDWDLTVWQLAWSLYTFQNRRGHRHDHVAVWQAALDAAGSLDLSARMLAHRRLGAALVSLGRHDEAIAHAHRALELAEQSRDADQQATTHYMLAWAWGQRGDRQALEHAVEHARHTLDLRRALEQPALEAQALNQIGWHLAHLGDFESARAHCESALEIQRRLHDPESEAATLDSLAYIANQTGRQRQAIEYYRRILPVYCDLGHLRQAADTFESLGRPHLALGEYEQARTAWQEAVTLYRQCGLDEKAESVQRELDSLESARGRPAAT